MQRITNMKIMSRISLIIIILSIFVQVNAQQPPLRIKKKEFKVAEYGFKEAWYSVRDGNRLYAAGPGSYRDAREFYMEAYKYNPNNPELNYMIGKCFLFTDNKFESIKYIQKAYELKPEVNFDIRLLLGMAYHQINEFDNAIEEYNLFLKNLPLKQQAPYAEKVNMLIRQCKHGRDIVLDPKRVVINNLGEGVNSVYDEYSIAMDKDETEMYFTSRRQLTEKSKRSAVDDKFFEDVYHTSFKNGKWSTAERISPKLIGKKNTTNIAVIGLSPDKTKLYLYKGKENGGDIYVSEFKPEKDKWKSPKPIKKFNTKNRETSLCMSSDESKLYFISSNNKTSYGGTDIYFSEKNLKDKWGKPKNIGNTINTFYDEVGVSLSANDSVLFFSSQGHNSIGGFDVFRSELQNVNLWSKPENLGYPINTPSDDVYYSEADDAQTAYYCSNRESGIGGLDVYKIIYLGSEKQASLGIILNPLVGIVPPFDIYFDEPQALKVDTRLTMRGFITDSENKESIMAKLELIDQETDEIVAIAISDSTGNYSVRVPEAKSYGIDINAKGYLMYLDVLDLSRETYEEVIVRNFELERVEVGAKMILKNIYFETGKAELKPESYTTLNAVVKLMQSNPTLVLEISGHTDNVGSKKYNDNLSRARAKSCVDYLVQQGIAEDKLQYKGYGFQFPIFPNTNAEGRAKNRRVEFKIISK
jgi:outer membrane protein OmpA-like peptidoglycan-associated protein